MRLLTDDGEAVWCRITGVRFLDEDHTKSVVEVELDGYDNCQTIFLEAIKEEHEFITGEKE
jgi:hypothetical protein